jgi:putative transposase
VIVEFIREHAHRREPGGLRWGVEPICAVLTEHGVKIAPSTYYEFLHRGPSPRQAREEVVKVEIARVHRENFGVYGARKVWLHLNRELAAGRPSMLQVGYVARCTVERLMPDLGLVGARRGKVKKTTIADVERSRADDLVGRQFAPTAPDRLWVCDITYVSTWSGWVYTAFVTDAYARHILGWRCGSAMTTDLVLDALEQAVWTRQRHGQPLDSVAAHSDRGSQYTSIRYTERLADARPGRLGRVRRRLPVNRLRGTDLTTDRAWGDGFRHVVGVVCTSLEGELARTCDDEPMAWGVSCRPR